MNQTYYCVLYNYIYQIMNPFHNKAIIKQSRAVDGNKQRPALHAIIKRGGYAYFTDRFTVVRWDLGELSQGIEDDSYIPIDRSYASMASQGVYIVTLADGRKAW